jgi:RIO-like serine/threonine protein kinase
LLFLQYSIRLVAAHDGAFFDAHILHRDISVGNIIIMTEGEGLLIDWDLCINLRNEDAAARRPERTVRVPHSTFSTRFVELLSQGTWQFMSAKLLSELT